nr:hypothetical protein CFP56_60135 [Quercus suber]
MCSDTPIFISFAMAWMLNSKAVGESSSIHSVAPPLETCHRPENAMMGFLALAAVNKGFTLLSVMATSRISTT